MVMYIHNIIADGYIIPSIVSIIWLPSFPLTNEPEKRIISSSVTTPIYSVLKIGINLNLNCTRRASTRHPGTGGVISTFLAEGGGEANISNPLSTHTSENIIIIP